MKKIYLWTVKVPVLATLIFPLAVVGAGLFVVLKVLYRAFTLPLRLISVWKGKGWVLGFEYRNQSELYDEIDKILSKIK